jgi:PHD/YefM family antitoxin component YafN of YafNO toxin-antitoxin module
MLQISEKTTLVGITNLRTEGRKMLKQLKVSRVILTDRNKPCAVVLDYEEYEKMRELIEMAEEGVDAIEIAKRKNRSKTFLTHQQVMKALHQK